MPGTRMTAGPDPFSITRSVPQGLACLQSKRDPVLRFLFAAQAEKRFAFQVQQRILGDCRAMRHVSSGHYPCELAADQGVMVTDAARAMREVNAKREGRKLVRSAHGNLCEP